MHADIRLRSITERRRDFWFVFLVSYPLFLVAAIVERVFFARRPGAERRSVFAEASATAYRTLPYAF